MRPQELERLQNKLAIAIDIERDPTIKANALKVAADFCRLISIITDTSAAKYDRMMRQIHTLQAGRGFFRPLPVDARAKIDDLHRDAVIVENERRNRLEMVGVMIKDTIDLLYCNPRSDAANVQYYREVTAAPIDTGENTATASKATAAVTALTAALSVILASIPVGLDDTTRWILSSVAVASVSVSVVAIYMFTRNDQVLMRNHMRDFADALIRRRAAEDTTQSVMEEGYSEVKEGESLAL